MVSAESSSVDLGPLPTPEKDPASAEEDEKKKVTTTLTEVEADLLCNWLTSTLGPQRVRNVKTTVRLSDSPAIVTDHESGALRRMMKMLVSTAETSFFVFDEAHLHPSPFIPIFYYNSSKSHIFLLLIHYQNQSNPGNKQADLPPQSLEINPSHKIIIALAQAHGVPEKEAVAALVAQQVMDNALIAAGLIDDPRLMLSRLNSILEATLTK